MLFRKHHRYSVLVLNIYKHRTVYAVIHLDARSTVTRAICISDNVIRAAAEALWRDEISEMRYLRVKAYEVWRHEGKPTSFELKLGSGLFSKYTVRAVTYFAIIIERSGIVDTYVTRKNHWRALSTAFLFGPLGTHES